MTTVQVLSQAALRIDEIYQYSRGQWGDAQALVYARGLFRAIEQLGVQTAPSRPIPAKFGVAGYYFRYEKHFVYWRYLANGDVGIFTVLHERMHQVHRLRRDFGA